MNQAVFKLPNDETRTIGQMVTEEALKWESVSADSSTGRTVIDPEVALGVLTTMIDILYSKRVLSIEDVERLTGVFGIQEI
jgi:hypothetical protein